MKTIITTVVCVTLPISLAMNYFYALPVIKSSISQVETAYNPSQRVALNETVKEAYKEDQDKLPVMARSGEIDYDEGF